MVTVNWLSNYRVANINKKSMQLLLQGMCIHSVVVQSVFRLASHSFSMETGKNPAQRIAQAKWEEWKNTLRILCNFMQMKSEHSWEMAKLIALCGMVSSLFTPMFSKATLESVQGKIEATDMEWIG